MCVVIYRKELVRSHTVAASMQPNDIFEASSFSPAGKDGWLFFLPCLSLRVFFSCCSSKFIVLLMFKMKVVPFFNFHEKENRMSSK